MAEDKSQVGNPDRLFVSGSEDYEVRDFAKANGITPDQVRELIQRHGNSRAKLEEEAQKLR